MLLMSSTLHPSSLGRSAARNARVQVFFDADCGFCTHSSEVLERLDWRRRLEFVPLQRAAQATADAPPLDVLIRAMHVHDPADEWFVGGAACVRLAREVPLLIPLAVLARRPVISSLVEPAYAFVSAHRHQLGRLLGADTCSIDRAGPAPRL